MQQQDVRAAVDLIARAMNPFEADLSEKTFDFYFTCISNTVDSARQYYCAWQDDELCGLVGLHHYRWGPPANTWLSWFAVHPDCRRRGIGKRMIDYIQHVALILGYSKLLVETYDSVEFAEARRFYDKQGFKQLGQIEKYIDDKVAMLVYGKRL